MENIRVVSDPRASAADVDSVRDGLSLSNVAATGGSAYSPLAIHLKAERDAILGGAYGHGWGDGWRDGWRDGWGDGRTSPCPGLRSRSAGRATVGNLCRRRKTRLGSRDAAASSCRP